MQSVVQMPPQAPVAPPLAAVLRQFPPVRYAFAYGSGVFRQPGLYEKAAAEKAVQQAKAGPMLDIILAVDDPAVWHSQNIERNRQHYSGLAALGGSVVACNASRIGAGVHFNPSVPWHDQLIKYGVIGKERMHSDLVNWDSLYIAGRMHKPVLTLQPDGDIAAAQECNLQAAMAVSLLLLSERFTVQDLLRQICSLSYTGDVRMGIAEDTRKVDRIVEGSLEGLREMYTPQLQGSLAQQAGLTCVRDGNWGQDISPEARQRLLQALPKGVMVQLAHSVRLSIDAEGMMPEVSHEVAEAVVKTGQHQQLLRSAISNIVGASSRRQAVSGFLAAGPLRSCAYVWQKLLKSWRSRQPAPNLL